MSANLNNAKELFSRLTKGSTHLIGFVDSGWVERLLFKISKCETRKDA